VLSLWTLHFKV